MDTIDLDAILERFGLDGHGIKRLANRAALTETINQALVLASKNARTETKGFSDGYECWDVTSVDEQSILDVEKFIK